MTFRNLAIVLSIIIFSLILQNRIYSEVTKPAGSAGGQANQRNFYILPAEGGRDRFLKENINKITYINIYDTNLDFPILKKFFDFGFFCTEKYAVKLSANNDKSSNLNGIVLESNIKTINNMDYAVFNLIPENYNQKIIFIWQTPKEKAEDVLLSASFDKLLELSVEAGKKDINEVIFENIANGNIQAAEPLYDNDNNEPGSDEVNGYNLKIKSKPSQTHRFFRTLGELFVLNSFGVINYWVNKDDNMEDWEYKPTREGFKRKITDGWSLDTNAFRTNTIYHIYAGNIYFQTGRSNGYGFTASVVWAAVGSLIWEYIGEFREQVSTNDMIFTTMGGALVGESLRQGSIYIEHNVQNKIFRYFFMTMLDPMRIINRAIDRYLYDDIDVSVTFINPVYSLLQQSYNQQCFADFVIRL